MDEESWHLLSHLIDSKNIKRLIQKKEQGKEGKGSMCKALDDLIAEGKAEDIIILLEEHGELSSDLRTRILAQKDLIVLKKWLRLAASVESAEEFLQKIG